jgi:hypothetical protein
MPAAKKGETWADVIRLNDPEQRDRLALVQEAMSAKLSGVRLPRAVVLAAVVGKGLEVVERELGIKRK